jgi:hypothetical protein
MLERLLQIPQVLCNWSLFIIIGSIILTLTGIAIIFWIVEAHGQIAQLDNSNITRPAPPRSDGNITIPDQVYVIYNGSLVLVNTTSGELRTDIIQISPPTPTPTSIPEPVTESQIKFFNEVRDIQDNIEVREDLEDHYECGEAAMCDVVGPIGSNEAYILLEYFGNATKDQVKWSYLTKQNVTATLSESTPTTPTPEPTPIEESMLAEEDTFKEDNGGSGGLDSGSEETPPMEEPPDEIIEGEDNSGANEEVGDNIIP